MLSTPSLTSLPNVAFETLKNPETAGQNLLLEGEFL